MKKRGLIVTIIVNSIVVLAVLLCILFPITLYSAITITNNQIAIEIEDKLKSVELPEGTELVDSMWLAGKYFGNGHGMQYFGAILVSSELEADELQAYYRNYIQSDDIVDVVKQQTAAIFDDPYYGEWGLAFENFNSDNNNYMIYCLEAKTSGWDDNSFIIELLDRDFRRY